VDQPEVVSHDLTPHDITVFLVDDQPMIGEAVRRMLAAESDIKFHYCSKPGEAVAKATEIQPTVILQDLVMPDIDGISLVTMFRAEPATKNIPLIVLSTKEEPIVKAKAFEVGANDYLVKLPDRIELIARVRYHSRGYINLLQRNEAYRALLESQNALAAELAEAAAYVRSLLPEPLTGDVAADWCFIPSTALGGDIFGYHWLDDRHLACHVLDVCGHGVGAALMSISADNVIRTRMLPDTDFRKPDQVLRALNTAFPMEQHNGMYFTIWYGVIDKVQRTVTYACGGHPPGVLLKGEGTGPGDVELLKASGPIIGFVPNVAFEARTIEAPPGSRLYVFSDGVYELPQPDGSMGSLEQFVHIVTKPTESGVSSMDRIIRSIRASTTADAFPDDFSLLEIVL